MRGMIICDIKRHLVQQGFLISASPSRLTQADCSAQLGGRAAAVAAAVKRWATDLSDHSYPSSKRGLQANHTQLSRAPPRSTSSTQRHRDTTEMLLRLSCVPRGEDRVRRSAEMMENEPARVLIAALHVWLW